MFHSVSRNLRRILAFQTRDDTARDLGDTPRRRSPVDYGEATKAEVVSYAEAMKGRMKGVRAHLEETAEDLQDLAISAGGAYAFQRYKTSQQQAGARMETFGLDIEAEVLYGGAMYLIGRKIKGKAGQVVREVGRGILIGFAAQKGAGR
jgi:hypothetical protein